MNRRQFFIFSASAVVLACAQGRTLTSGSSARSSSIQTSVEGLLQVDLEARRETVNLAGRQVTLLSYNGQIPGPQLVAYPGDTVRIRCTNQLSNPTNLHYHGLHIPPTGQADNIFLKIPRGETLTYEFTIPREHPGGNFYYHPHVHGLVADQVFGGLGGLFIIRGELDQIPEVQAASERFLFLKDFAIAANDPLLGQHGHPMAHMGGREGSLITVNGQVNPILTIASGGLLRLRCVNASNARFYRLALEEHPFYLIATDGIPLAEPVELRDLLLSPGERVEVLVRGDRPPGQYQLLDLPYDRGSMGMMGPGHMGPGHMGPGHMGPRHRGPRGSEWPGRTEAGRPLPLATLRYRGQVSKQPLPQQLLPIEPLSHPQTLRQFTLDHGMGRVFLINGQAFDHQRVDTRVMLNTVEDWEIVNVGVMDHPFHLHTNPFQVLSRNGVAMPYRAWKDTVLVPVGASVKLRVQFKDFPGKTVYHCHILDHEDLGMMGLLDIQV